MNFIFQKQSSISANRKDKLQLFKQYLMLLYILKFNVQIPRDISSFILFFNMIYPTFISLEQQYFYSQQKNSIQQILLFSIRPDLIFQSSLLYLIPLILFLFHKSSGVILLYYYLTSKNQERFVRLISKKIFLKVLGLFFTLYLKLINTFLLIIYSLLCIASFKIQFEQSKQDNLPSFHIICNFLTIILLFLESSFVLYFYSSSITHQQKDIETTRVTYLRVLYQILILLQIFMVFFWNSKHYFFIQSAIAIFSQITLLIDQFYNLVYSLNHQQQSIALAISINISFYFAALVSTNISFKSLLVPFLINQILIYQIIGNYYDRFNKYTLKVLFNKKLQTYWPLKYWLIKLINNDINNNNFELVFKSFIASYHRFDCDDVNCIFCSRSNIIFPTLTGGITNKIYNQFLLKKLKQFLALESLNQQSSSQNQGLLSYAFILYDFGMIMKAIKILCFLKENHQNSENLKIQSFSQFQEDNYQNLELINQKKLQSQDPQDLFNDLAKIVQDPILMQFYLNQRQFGQYLMIDKIKLQFMFECAKANINSSLGTSRETLQQFYISNYTEEIIEKDLQINIQEKNLLKLIDAKIDIYQQIVSTSQIKQTIRHFHQKVHKLCYQFYALDKELKKAYAQNPCFHLHRIICYFLGEILGEYRRAINFYKNSEFFETKILQFKQIKNFNINSQRVHYLILEAKDDMETFNIQSYSNKFFLSFGNSSNTAQIHQFNDLLPIYLVQHHCSYVRQFFETAEAKFYQQFDLSFIRNTNTLLTPINMCFSITNKFINKNITFAAFLQDTLYDQAYILVDDISLNCMFTQNLLILIGWKESEIQQLSKQDRQKEFDINKIFPKFDKLVRVNQEKYLRLNQCDLILPKMQETVSTQRSLYSENSQIYLQYIDCQCDLIIIKRSIGGYNYYIINIVKIVEAQTIEIINQKINYSQQKTLENKQLQFPDNQTSLEQVQIWSQSLNKENIKNHNKNIDKKSNLEYTQIDKMYSLIQSILSVKTPKYLQKFVILMLIWHSIFIMFVIIFYVSLQSDINLVKSHLEMISFYAAIMAPHDLFFSMRVTITAYQQMQREGFLTQGQVTELTNPYYENIELGFTELRDSFYDQLNNQYLKNFLNDITVTMYFMQKDEKSIYPIDVTFRDALLIILQYQYAQMMTFYHRQSTSGKPFQISLFANYFMLHSQCELLTNDIAIYSIENKNYINRKWLIITFIGFVSLILFYIIIQCYQIYFFGQLDSLYELINCLTYDIVQKEIDKFGDYISNYKLDRYIILEYNPLDRYCKQIENYQKKLGQNYIKVKIKTKNQSKLVNYSMLFLLCLLLCFYFILIFSSTQLYLQQYEKNLNFYKKLQDYKLRPGSLYLYREIFFRWSNFTFLTEDNQQQLYSLVFKAEQSIMDYLKNTNSFYVNSQIIDEEFDRLFSKVSQENLCQFIDQKFQNLTSKYCNLSFDGSLKSGMINTLIYIKHSIQTQQGINNFTKRVEISLYEQEGSQIITRVFFSLSDQFSKSVGLKADICIQVIKAISISFIVYILLVLLLMQILYRPYLEKLFKVLKRSVHLIPFDCLLQSETLEMRLKSINYKLQLL